MKYAQLGRTGASVSRIVLGTMNFGRVIDEAESHRILDRALDEGINFFDTANTYGAEGHKGLTEEIIGRWFASRPGARDKVVLATKVYGPFDDWPNFGGLSAVNIRRAVDASLRRLGTDHIDLYQFHHVDRSAPWDEVWQAIDVLIGQGKITYTGSSNFAGWHIAEAQSARERDHRLGLVSEQSFYNLVTRQIEREVIPAAERFGLSIIAWSPLQSGLLAGSSSDAVRRLGGRALDVREAVGDRLDRFVDLSRGLGATPAEVALAWLLAQPAVLGPIVGPRTEEQLESAIRSLDVVLDADALAAIDAIFPPAGVAPEYYSW